MLPCWALIGDQDVSGKEAEWRLAHFYSLITFTGPQSHLRNHGDADKVTHDYSSMALPDWTAPESNVKRIHQHSLPQYAPQDDEEASLLLSVCFWYSLLVLPSAPTSPIFSLIAYVSPLPSVPPAPVTPLLPVLVLS